MVGHLAGAIACHQNRNLLIGQAALGPATAPLPRTPTTTVRGQLLALAFEGAQEVGLVGFDHAAQMLILGLPGHDQKPGRQRKAVVRCTPMQAAALRTLKPASISSV